MWTKMNNVDVHCNVIHCNKKWGAAEAVAVGDWAVKPQHIQTVNCRHH